MSAMDKKKNNNKSIKEGTELVLWNVHADFRAVTFTSSLLKRP